MREGLSAKMGSENNPPPADNFDFFHFLIAEYLELTSTDQLFFISEK